jgi:hypothetical protein
MISTGFADNYLLCSKFGIFGILIYLVFLKSMKTAQKIIYMYYYSNEGAMPFAINLMGLRIALKLSFRLLIYSPILITAYILSSSILHKKDSVFFWLGFTLLFAYCIHKIFMFMGKLIRVWRIKGNLLWIPLFLFCVVFTCVPPVYFAFGTVYKIIARYAHESNPLLLTWIVSLSFGYFIYSRYHFLRRNADIIVFLHKSFHKFRPLPATCLQGTTA